jgi:hypothetical protein
MGDVIRLRRAQGISVDPRIVEIWEASRENGGLQWNRPEKQTVYNEVVGKHN